MNLKEEFVEGGSLITSNNTCWYSISQSSIRKDKSAPCARWGHSSALLEKNLFIYGGAGDKTGAKHWETMYRLDLETWEWTKLQATNKAPSSRDSHTLTVFQNKLYLFGGSHESETLNDLYEYDLSTNAWKQIEAKGEAPPPREGHSACLYKERYLIIFGGWNGDEALNDFYAFDLIDQEWIKIQNQNWSEPVAREGHSCCLIKDDLYLFGGQGNGIIQNEESMELFFNDLYKFQIVFGNKTGIATFEKIEPIGALPDHRSSHSASVYKDRYLVVVGGEGYPNHNQTKANPMSEENYSCFPKRDVWIYDTETNKWSSPKIKNEKEMIPRFTHSCDSFQDYFIVFGGLEDYQNSSNVLYVLSLNGTSPFPNDSRQQQGQISSEKDSLSRVVPAKEKTELEGFTISAGFLSHLASSMNWPLAAFGLLLDNAVISKAQNFKIDVKTKQKRLSESIISEELKKTHSSEEDITYLQIENDGDAWEYYDFIDIFMRHDVDLHKVEPNEEESGRINEYAFNLKVGSLRLGRTFIYVSKSQDEISISFMSSDRKYNPDIHGSHVFLYSWRISTQEYLTNQAQKNKDIIMNALSGIFTEDDLLEGMETLSTRLLIMDLHPVAVIRSGTQQKQDLELLFRKSDIFVRTLDKNLQSFYKNPLIELSLRTYLRHFFLNPVQANIKISLNGEPIPLVNIQETIESSPAEPNFAIKTVSEPWFNSQFIQKFVSGNDEEEKDRELKLKDHKEDLQKAGYNQGMLVYYDNRLVRRLENPKLGNLDFLSLQIRSRLHNNQPLTPLFNLHGFVELKNPLKPNVFKTVKL